MKSHIEEWTNILDPQILKSNLEFISLYIALNAVVRLFKGSGLPVKTIATDNGTEFAAHEIIARELGTTVYFAHPYCSWEKGAIENMNGLFRQYILQRTDFRGISRGYVRQIVEKLNNRPRKKNGFSKPADMINDRIA